MIGDLDPSKRCVHVIGGGIAGLLIAYRLDQLGWEVTLSEASSRLGGLIQTERTPEGISESAAHSLLVSEPVGRLFDELGVSLTPILPHARARWVVRDGALRRFPLTFFEAISAVFRAYFVRAPRTADASRVDLQTWSLRHLGRAAHDYLIQPMVQGIYAAHPRELLVGRVFARLWIEPGQSLISQLLRKKWRNRSNTKVSRALMQVPARGMGALVEALEAHLRARLGSRLQLESPITSLDQVASDSNRVIALPALATARLLVSADPDVSTAISQIPYAPLVSVTVFFKSHAVAHLKRGVGYLVPEREHHSVLGILMNSFSFLGRSEQGYESFSVMLGGTGAPHWPDRADSEILSAVAQEFALTLGVTEAPVRSVIYRWSAAVPIYGISRERAVQFLRSSWCAKPGQVVFANWSGEVSIRGMIESLSAYGKKAAGTRDH